MDKERKKLKVIEIKQSIQANAIAVSVIAGLFGSAFSIFLAFVLSPLCLIGVVMFILIAVWVYNFMMEKGLKASKKHYKGILRFD